MTVLTRDQVRVSRRISMVLRHHPESAGLTLDANGWVPVAELLAAHRQRRGIAPRSHSDTEILERCLFVMINEAAWLLEEGIVEQPVDIDLVWLHGYGFPRYRGGLLYHADQCGLERIVSALEGWSAALGERGTRISPRLRQLAAEGRTFLDL